MDLPAGSVDSRQRGAVSLQTNRLMDPLQSGARRGDGCTNPAHSARHNAVRRVVACATRGEGE